MKALFTAHNSQAHSLVIRHAIIGIFLLLLLLPANAQAQSDYVEYYGQSLRINNIGMAVPGSWALANISFGAYGWSKQCAQQSYFHQMSVFWNTLNLSIAGFALYSNLTSDNALLPGDELLEMQYKTQGLYLINAAVVIFPMQETWGFVTTNQF